MKVFAALFFWIAATVLNVAAQDTQTTSNLTMEHRHTIAEFLKTAKTPRQTGIAPNEDNVVPLSIPLEPIPPELANKVPQIKQHMFFLTDKEVVLVGSERRISDVIKLD
jgi:hypothetical protein